MTNQDTEGSPVKADELTDDELRDYFEEEFNQKRCGPINQFTRLYYEMFAIELIHRARSLNRQLQFPTKKGRYTKDWLKLITQKEPYSPKKRRSSRRQSSRASQTTQSIRDETISLGRQESFTTGIKSSSTPFSYYDTAPGAILRTTARDDGAFSSFLKSLSPLQVGIPVALFILMIIIWLKSLLKGQGQEES